jgi:hypothetical protein
MSGLVIASDNIRTALEQADFPMAALVVSDDDTR